MFPEQVVWLSEAVYLRAKQSAQPHTFLIVAEEELLGQALISMLQEHGYVAYLAQNPLEVGRLVALRPEIDVTIFDAASATIELWWLIDGLLQLRPQMRILTSFAQPASSSIEIPIDGELSANWDVAELNRTLRQIYRVGSWNLPVSN